ncbi:MAG: RnfABCDGE type electron transport complex subunit D [Thermoanaerobaculia bacterium]
MTAPPRLPPLPRDPRIYQIAALSGLLLYGMLFRGFDVTPLRAAVILIAALASQYACTRVWKLPVFDSKSALISALSLCLLLRTNFAALAILTAAVTIASKFAIRWDGKHVFNPTNFGLVAMMLATDAVWVSPGQWGSGVFFAFAIACAGLVVVQRAARADVTFTFLGVYAALLILRALWLGEPLAIPFHRLESGALLLFAFFMISDPKTTPDRREARILFAALVAAGAAWIHLRMFRTNGLLWSLAAFSALVPLLDRLLPGERHAWVRGPFPVRALSKGDPREARRDWLSLHPLPARREPPDGGVLRLLRGEGGREAL